MIGRETCAKPAVGVFALGLVLTFAASAELCSGGTPVFINEIHYDNAGTDMGEAIEVAGPAGEGLSGWSIVLYNGTWDPTAGT